MIKHLQIKSGQKKIVPLILTGDPDGVTYSVDLLGRGAELTLLLLLFGQNSAKMPVNINVVHHSPETKSRVLIKGVITDNSRADISGLIKILPGAVGSDAWLSAKLLLLSETASGQVIPNLEILENEVKAGHAASVGRINETELFYLMSRGLSEPKAKELLIKGFFAGLLREFPQQYVKQAEKLLAPII
jgi:Fe-S cluster assembly scaffold protein SufB